MKTFDVIALGELNVDLILNRIAGFPEVGKEIFARDMICTLGSSTAIFRRQRLGAGRPTAFAGHDRPRRLRGAWCAEVSRRAAWIRAM